MDYVKLGLYKIKEKLLEVIYRLELPIKMKIYLVQHIVMLEPATGEIEPLVYKMEIYRGQEEDKWDI